MSKANSNCGFSAFTTFIPPDSNTTYTSCGDVAAICSDNVTVISGMGDDMYGMPTSKDNPSVLSDCLRRNGVKGEVTVLANGAHGAIKKAIYLMFACYMLTLAVATEVTIRKITVNGRYRPTCAAGPENGIGNNPLFSCFDLEQIDYVLCNAIIEQLKAGVTFPDAASNEVIEITASDGSQECVLSYRDSTSTTTSGLAYNLVGKAPQHCGNLAVSVCAYDNPVLMWLANGQNHLNVPAQLAKRESDSFVVSRIITYDTSIIGRSLLGSLIPDKASQRGHTLKAEKCLSPRV